MSLRGATVLVLVPGRNTIRFEVPERWPLSLLAVLLLPLSIGVAARHGWEARHGEPLEMMRAGELAGSLYRAQGVLPATRAGSPYRAQRESPAVRAATLPVARKLRAPASAPATPPARAAAIVSATPILRAFQERSGLDRDAAGSPQTDGQPAFLRLVALRLGESVRLQPFDTTGASDAGAFAALSHLMRCRVTGEEIAIDPRLVRILAQLAGEYGRPIQLISGHRAPHANGTSETSQHTTGRAADIRIAGVTIEALQRRAIDLGATGVGLYPEKGFVHVDVRPRPRAYWLYTKAGGEQLFDHPDEAAAALLAPPGEPADPTTGEHADDE